MNIFPPNFFLVALWISALNLGYRVLGEEYSSQVLPSPTQCSNCGVCQQPPCHPLSPPSPLSGYPSYGAPPPPAAPSGNPSYGTPPPPSLPGYPSYGAVPPPPRPGQPNCPPATPAECCQYPIPSTPKPYQYEPLDDHSPIPYIPLSAFPIVTMLLSFVVLF